MQASIHAEEPDARLVPHAAEAQDATRVEEQNDFRAPNVLPLAEEQRNEAQPVQQLAVIRFGERSGARLAEQAPAWFPCEGLEKDATRHAARKLRAVLASAYPPELDGMSHGVRFWTDRDAILPVMLAF